MQKVRSFKLRGAYYAITQADPELTVVASSVPVPETMRKVLLIPVKNSRSERLFSCRQRRHSKNRASPLFGGDYVKIELVGDTFDAAAQAAKHFAKEQQMAFIAPFDDPNIIAGQGTVAVEMLADAEKTSNDRSGRGSDWRGRLDQRNRSLFERKATEDKSC